MSVPVTGSPFVWTLTLLIVPPAADTRIPLFGVESTLPLVGVIDTRASPLDEAPWLDADFPPPPHAARSKPRVAHVTSVPRPLSTSRDHPNRLKSGKAACRKL
ncbi:MAG: hypothetical protein E6G05_13130 [Actinobacteria bacterium]|nr:MAG: hypothetical protein E6G05_13130 [Actinomycetota bacterium]